MKKRVFAAFLAICMLAFLVSGCAKRTETYPNRTIELLIPFSTGGASDITAREFAKVLEKYLGQSITCTNKSSGGTVEGLEYAYAQNADGYTLFWLTNSVLMKEAQNAASVKFTETFDPLLMVAADLTVISVAKNNAKGIATMEDLISYAKANPGNLKIAGTSPGGFDDYQQVCVADELGISWTYVPYSGGSEVKTAVLGGEADVYQDKIASCLSLLESGDIIPLCVINTEQITSIPQLVGVPCTKDLGVEFSVGPWRGISVRSEVDDAIRQQLKKACADAYNDADFQAYLASNYLNIRSATPQDTLTNAWKAEVESYKPFYGI